MYYDRGAVGKAYEFIWLIIVVAQLLLSWRVVCHCNAVLFCATQVLFELITHSYYYYYQNGIVPCVVMILLLCCVFHFLFCVGSK